MNIITKLEKSKKEKFFTCPAAGRITRHRKKVKNSKWIFILAGFLGLLWFLIRVVPKPDRALYPCQRLAAPFAFGFAAWLAGNTATRLPRRFFLKSRIPLKVSGIIALAAIILVIVFVFYSPLNFTDNWTLPGYSPFGKPNTPIGVPKGINPGRVVWIRDKNAAKFDGEGFWWEESSTDQDAVNEMISKSVRWLTGEPSDKESWDKIFKYFNRNKNGIERGYKKGEKIVIKINMNQDRGGAWKNQHMPSPQVIYALVNQLINVAGVKGKDITIADPSRYIGDPLYNKIHGDINPQFQAVRFVGQNRIFPIEDMGNPVYFSGGSIPDAGVPAVYVEAKYLINIALLRAHTMF